MGTRGWFAFLYKGEYYRVYNHWDSYFTGLGVKLVNELIAGGSDFLAALRTLLELAVVEEEGKIQVPTESQRLQEWNDAVASLPNGHVAKFFEEKDCNDLTFTSHTEKFLCGDGIFIEYIYLIDLDMYILMCYRKLIFRKG